jgi:CheY-like chemotaxis protein
MNSTKNLHRFYSEINDANLSSEARALVRCRWAKRLEEIGNYDAACEALGDLWGGIGEQPKVEGLDQRTAAEVLLRAGALTGWIGSTRQIEGAQETAKNLMTECIAIFESISDEKKVAEAQVEIAVCYRRIGELDNARVVLTKALSKLDESDGDLRGVALVRLAFVEKVATRFIEALNILTKAAPLFESSANQTLKGRFHNELAIVLENLAAIENRSDYLDRAAMEYTAASLDFEEAGHSRYQACVENNLAMLYLKVKRISDAHEHLDRAQALFTRLDDTVHLAQVDETRARAWLAEGAFGKAERQARTAVTMLEQGDEPLLLSEALITHGIALSRLHQKEPAHDKFERAIVVAEQAGELEKAGLAAIALVEEIGTDLSDAELCEILRRAREFLKHNENAVANKRLLECAFYVLSLVHTFPSDWTNYSFDRSVRRYEERELRRALEDAGGNISQAARLLGLTHQRLHQILKNRHKNLRHVLAEIIAAEQESDPTADSISDVNEREGKKAQPGRILHVEDDLTLAGLVHEMAEHEGWELKHYLDGKAALSELFGDRQFDLLLVDYELPGLNGLELIRRARTIDNRQGMRIVMMSGTLDRASAIEAGADEFLRKPQDIGSLVETVNSLLEEHEQLD